MKKTMLLTATLLAGSLSAVWAQSMTKQQALDEIARIERFNAQVDTMLRQAWEAGRTQKETVIDTPYGKITVKFNLAEIINSTKTGDSREFDLRTLHGVQQGNEIRINTGSSMNKTPEGIKGTIAHELGHWMDRRPNKVAMTHWDYGTAEDTAETEADAFALRYMDKVNYVGGLGGFGGGWAPQHDRIIKRSLEMEREERENLNRLRNIAGLPPQNQPQSFSTARSYFDSGKAALDKKEYYKAIACFSLAIGLDPNNAEAYYRRAEASEALAAEKFAPIGRIMNAVTGYTEAVRLDPNNNTYKEALRKAQEKQQAAQQESQQLRSADPYYNSGKAALDNKDYDKAIADFTEAIRIKPDYNIYYFFRAKAYEVKRDWDKVIADYTEAIRIKDDYTYYEYRAKAYIAKKDWDNAIADYTELIRKIPSSGDYYSLRAKAYIAKGDWDKAVADYTSAVAKYSEDVRRNPNADYYKRDLIKAQETVSAINSGKAALDKKNWDKAIADYTELIRLIPNSAGTYSRRAEAYIGKRKYKEARADVDKALQLDPNNQKAKDLDAELKKRRQ